MLPALCYLPYSTFSYLFVLCLFTCCLITTVSLYENAPCHLHWLNSAVSVRSLRVGMLQQTRATELDFNDFFWLITNTSAPLTLPLDLTDSQQTSSYLTLYFLNYNLWSLKKYFICSRCCFRHRRSSSTSAALVSVFSVSRTTDGCI